MAAGLMYALHHLQEHYRSQLQRKAVINPRTPK